MGRRKSRQSNTPVTSAPLPLKPAKPAWLTHVLVAAALCLVTLLAYSNSFHAGFVRDSRPLILTDSRVHEATAENVNLIFGHTYWWPQFETALYRPITTLTYLVNYAVLDNADRPEGYHWVNFFLHGMNVLLVYALGLRMLRKLWPAALMAGLWAVHPVLTESVTNIIGRSDILAGTAILSGLLMYLRSIDARGWRVYVWLAGLMVVTTIGVFSKENAVAILVVLVLYQFTWWEKGQSASRLLRGFAAVVPPLVAMMWARISVLASSRPAQFAFVENPMQGAHFFTARLTALSVMARYLWRLAWPVTLSGDYSYSQIPLASGSVRDWIAWTAVVVIAVVARSRFRKNRLFFFFAGFAFVTFVPVSNLVILTGTVMAERFLYLPAVGFSGCVIVALYGLGDRFGIRLFAPVAVCLLIAGFAVRTWVRNLDWRDELTMATASVRTSPDSYKTHLELALALTEADPSRSNVDQVIVEMEKSMAILDSLPDSLNTSIVYATAGNDYAAKGDRLVQRDANGRAIISTSSKQAYERSLQVLMRGVAIDRASEPAYRERLRASGKYATIPIGLPQLYAQLASTNMRLGNSQQAYDAARFAHLLDPTRIEPYAVMGQSLARLGRREEAAAALVEGTLVSGQRNLLGMLEALYRSGVDPEGCAFTRNGSTANLNNSCAVVHRQTCEAWADLVQTYDENVRPELAGQARSQAIENFGCAADSRK
jgi:hypothetical protein